MTTSKRNIFIMSKLATLYCLSLLAACGDDSGKSVFTNIPTPDSEESLGEVSSVLCGDVSYSTQVNNTSGTDPLLASQWHLLNNSSNPGAIKQDINLQKTLWNEVTGSGVKIAIIDTSIDYSHPDLQFNLDLTNSCQFGSFTSGGHGTAVAGLISAVKENGQGIAGVAPDSQIQGFNTLDTDATVAVWEASLSTTNSRNSNIDIFNMSLGYGVEGNPLPYDISLESLAKSGTELGRNGLGALYFKASGNNFRDPLCSVSNYHSPLLPCQGSALDPDNNIPYLMVVSALNADGIKADYSSSGPNVLFSAPGGDDSAGVVTTNDIYLTSDLDDMDGHLGYTDAFTGTSAATPITSGVTALVLQANPGLGWRDVRDILIRTADKIDTGDNSSETDTLVISNSDELVSKTSTPLTNLIVEDTWKNNAAGLPYHNYYGFGRINAVNAVERAKAYTTNLPAMVSATSTNDSSGAIADDISAPLSSLLSAPAGVTTVESVQIKLTLSHPYISDLMVKLTSPSGTESILLTPRNALNTEINNYDLALLSQTFYGENAVGSWQLQIYDTHADTYGTGTLHSWSMTIYGH